MDREIIIPELEEMFGKLEFRHWDVEEETILRRYYGNVPFSLLMKYLGNRTPNSVRCKAKAMGITKR